MTAVDRLGFHVRLRTAEGMRGAPIAFMREVSKTIRVRPGKSCWKRCNWRARRPNDLCRGGMDELVQSATRLDIELERKRDSGHAPAYQKLLLI